MSRPLMPPATLGLIGGGQLGMMTIREAQRMGFRSIVWDPDPDCPASRLADETITAPFSDRTAAHRLGDRADAVTYEFEHIDAVLVEVLESINRMRPGSAILRVSQNRAQEKFELQRKGFPLARFEVAEDRDSIRRAVDRIGLPVVLKTTRAGYDGKGQTVVRTPEEMETFLRSGAVGDYVVEEFLDLACEVSVVVARDLHGGVFPFPVALNEHRDNILHTSILPAPVPADIGAAVQSLARHIIDSFSLVGVLCVEMFVTRDGKVLVNELAPRPHNSGHASLDGCDLSQFEALVRVVMGLPMRTPVLLRPCGIVNVLGKHLQRVDLEQLHRIDGTKLHLYGKKRLEPKRKMGHVSVVRTTVDEVKQGIRAVEELIGEAGTSPVASPATRTTKH